MDNNTQFSEELESFVDFYIDHFCENEYLKEDDFFNSLLKVFVYSAFYVWSNDSDIAPESCKAILDTMYDVFIDYSDNDFDDLVDEFFTAKKDPELFSAFKDTIIELAKESYNTIDALLSAYVLNMYAKALNDDEYNTEEIISNVEKLHQFTKEFNSLLAIIAMADDDIEVSEATAISELVLLLEQAFQDMFLEEYNYVIDSINGNNIDDEDEDEEDDEEDEYDVDDDFEDDPDEAQQLELESLMNELDSLIGLEDIKKDVKAIVSFIKVCNARKAAELMVPPISYHLVFMGDPGTGKTTVARLIAKIYKCLGILRKGQMVEAQRSTLVAGYLGQTAIKTEKVINEALGGVLFIDEAYSLVKENDQYGEECIETLLKEMDDHRDDLIVIVAGYNDLMRDFINSNPGLKSRFNKYFSFANYSGQELYDIFEKFCDDNEYHMRSEELENYVLKRFEKYAVAHDDNFGNARFVRNVFERAISAQAVRLTEDDAIIDYNNPSAKDRKRLRELSKSDIDWAFRKM